MLCKADLAAPAPAALAAISAACGGVDVLACSACTGAGIPQVFACAFSALTATSAAPPPPLASPSPTSRSPVSAGAAAVPALGTPVVELTGGHLTAADVIAVARHGAKVTLTAAALAKMSAARVFVEQAAASDRPTYGVTTGFGGLACVKIPHDRRCEMQAAILRSHAGGLGAAVGRDVVRAMMVLRLATLTKGISGVRGRVVEVGCAVLNAGVTPYVPEYGSLGASGDLAPLSHCMLTLLGEGLVLPESGPVASLAAARPAGPALEAAGVRPLAGLEAKEGLALVNSTDAMLGMLLLTLDDVGRVLPTADVAAAMSIEGLLGTDRPFAERLMALRPHPGALAVAGNLRVLLAGSELVAAHVDATHGVQDAYSLRCHPQILGAVRDTVAFARRTAEVELGAAVDNPVIVDGAVHSVGNFHGEPLAFACDFLTIALTDAANLAVARMDRLLDRARSRGLPPFLACDPGVDSGMMIAQYTAAGIAAEMRRRAHPASADSAVSSAMQEDHVSLGWGAARNVCAAVRDLGRVVAIEVAIAAAALNYREPLRPAAPTAAALATVRARVPRPGPDRYLAADLAACDELVWSGEVLLAVNATLPAPLA